VPSGVRRRLLRVYAHYQFLPAAWRPTLARWALQVAGYGRQGGHSRRWKSPCDFPIREDFMRVPLPAPMMTTASECSGEAIAQSRLSSGHRNIQVTDFFPQGIPIDAENFRRAQLIATAFVQDKGEQQFFHMR
jgi:hypothetical protein